MYVVAVPMMTCRILRIGSDHSSQISQMIRSVELISSGMKPLASPLARTGSDGNNQFSPVLMLGSCKEVLESLDSASRNQNARVATFRKLKKMEMESQTATSSAEDRLRLTERFLSAPLVIESPAS